MQDPFHRNPEFAERLLAYLLSRNIRTEGCDRLVAKSLPKCAFSARAGSGGKPLFFIPLFFIPGKSVVFTSWTKT